MVSVFQEIISTMFPNKVIRVIIPDVFRDLMEDINLKCRQKNNVLRERELELTDEAYSLIKSLNDNEVSFLFSFLKRKGRK